MPKRRKKAAHPPAATMTTAEAVVATLIGHGLDTIYALPGVQNDLLFEALYKFSNRLRTIHTRHEQGAAYMALGAALATGKPQAFAVVPGPGLLNAGAALLTAFATNAPVLGLIGQIPIGDIGRDLGQLHEIRDQAGIVARLVDHSALIQKPEQASRATALALRAMQSGRPGPAALECSMDVWGKSGPVTLQTPLPVPHTKIDLSAVRKAAKLLGGREAAADHLRRRRAGCVRGSHRAVGDAASAGARLSPRPRRARRPQSVQRHAAARARSVGRGRRGVGGRHAAPDPVPAMERRPRAENRPRRCRPKGAQAAAQAGGGADRRRRADPAKPASPNCRSTMPSAALARRRCRNARRRGASASKQRSAPQLAFLDAIRAELPEDGILVEDITQIVFAARVAFPVYKPRTYISPGFQDPLGLGFATALGAQYARPDVPVLAISGDGGFMFTATEMATAMRHRIPLVTIVFNDGAYGNVRRIQQERFGNRLIASDLANPDFVAFAKSFGAEAVRANDPDELRLALRRAFAHRDGPTLIEVPVGDLPSPWEFLNMADAGKMGLRITRGKVSFALAQRPCQASGT